MSEAMTKSGALVVLPVASLPTILAADDKDILGKLAAELRAFEADVTTSKGRAEIASKAHKVATAKMDLIRLGKSLTEGWREKTKAVNDECKMIEERMDALRDQVRAPLDEYQDREKRRVEGHEAAIREISLRPMICDDTASSSEISDCLDGLDSLHADRDWEEFALKAFTARTNASNALRVAYQTAKTRESEAEAARIAAEEQAEREREAALKAQIAREERIAAEAAERARIAAETRAAREAQEAEERAQTALRAQALAAERERAEALRKEREAADALARAETARIAAEEKAERDRVAAVEAERQRIAREAAAQKAEDDRRAADKAHRGRINREIVADLIGMASMHEAEAKELVILLATGKIRHVGISY